MITYELEGKPDVDSSTHTAVRAEGWGLHVAPTTYNRYRPTPGGFEGTEELAVGL